MKLDNGYYGRMKKLITPFGPVQILVDEVEVEYLTETVDRDKHNCPDLLGRYKISLSVIPDGKEHTISCIIPEIPDCKCEIESGEGLECQSFYSRNRMKLSIGLQCDEAYRGTDLYEYDYAAMYLENGMAYVIDGKTKTDSYVFGIAWIDDVDWGDNAEKTLHRDVQTWYGADPSMM